MHVFIVLFRLGLLLCFLKYWPLKYFSLSLSLFKWLPILNWKPAFLTLQPLTTFVLRTCSSNAYHLTLIAQWRQIYLLVMIYKNDHYSCLRALMGNIHLSAGCLKQWFSNLSQDPNHLGICCKFQFSGLTYQILDSKVLGRAQCPYT